MGEVGVLADSVIKTLDPWRFQSRPTPGPSLLSETRHFPDPTPRIGQWWRMPLSMSSQPSSVYDLIKTWDARLRTARRRFFLSLSSPGTRPRSTSEELMSDQTKATTRGERHEDIALRAATSRPQARITPPQSSATVFVCEGLYGSRPSLPFGFRILLITRVGCVSGLLHQRGPHCFSLLRSLALALAYTLSLSLSLSLSLLQLRLV